MAKSSSTPAPDTVPSNDRAAAALVFAAALAFLLATHAAFLTLPYHWDELGYFIPAARDLLAAGALIPYSTPPNVHPPLVMAYLAGAWKVFGYAIPVTRVAMLVLAAATLAAAFLLARRLQGTRTALAATALLAVSPPFFAQSMLAHLDLPAAGGVLLTLYWFHAGRPWPCALAATALVLTKETGVIVPALLLVLGLARRKPPWRLLLPCAVLSAWLLYLHAHTGHWFGSAEFGSYNVLQTLSPARFGLVLLRRLYQLGVANFHWIALLALWRGERLRPAERSLAAVLAGYVLFHSLLGGAVLFRYLLPGLALFYVLAAPRLRPPAAAALSAGLLAGQWWNPPYPFAYEDNLAVVDFVRLQQQAARWLAGHAAGRTVTTAWPLTDALTDPQAGYVSHGLPVRRVEDFTAQPEGKFALPPDGLLALYSRSWEPARGWQRWPPAASLLERYFDYRPQLPPEELAARYHLRPVAHWERRGQWLTILAPAGAPPVAAAPN